ncbi:MAG: hypothetical protein ACI88A_002445 [Paraglaciecola sp.]|jgi:hypothetical protein
MNNKVSPEAQEKGLKVAKSVQKPGQSKEQTKVIAQGIAKGIAEYKKQQSRKSRERDKLQKAKSRQLNQADSDPSPVEFTSGKYSKLPWLLLLLSWLAFAVYKLI